MTTSAFIPPMKWCGVPHPHEPHTWAEASPRGFTGFYASCPGSRVAVAEPPDSALGRCPRLIQCHRETGHQGDHEPDFGRTYATAVALAAFVDEQMAVYDDHDPNRPSYATVPWDDIAKLGELADAVLAARRTGHEGGHEAREGSSSQDLPESMCGNCGGVNPVWAAPSPLWNQVMRGGSINGEEEFGGIICPSCFAVLAEQAGLGVTGWRFIPEQVLVPLETVTPSGRVWSDAEFRWIELAAGVQPEGS